MPAAITNTSKYFKTKASPFVYKAQDDGQYYKYKNPDELLKDTGKQGWGAVNNVAGKLYQRPGEATVYEYNPYTGESYGIPDPETFDKYYKWSDVTKTNQDPSALWGKQSYLPSQNPSQKPSQNPSQKLNDMNPTEQFIQDKAKQIPSVQQAYQPVMDQYKAQLDKLLNPVTQSYDKQISELQGRANIEDYYKKLSGQYKLGDQENLIKRLTQQMLSTEGLMSSLPQDVADTTKDYNVTQSGRNMQIGRQGEILGNTMGNLSRAFDSGTAGYELSLGAIERLLGSRREQEGRNMESLNTGLEKNKYLYDQYQPEAYNRMSTNLSGIGTDMDNQTQTIRDIIAERLGLAQEQRGLLANEGQNAYNQQMTEEDRAYEESLRQRMRGEELTDYENKYKLQQGLQDQYSAPKSSPSYSPKATTPATKPTTKVDNNERLYWLDQINQMGGNLSKNTSMTEIMAYLKKLSSEGVQGLNGASNNSLRF